MKQKIAMALVICGMISMMIFVVQDANQRRAELKEDARLACVTNLSFIHTASDSLRYLSLTPSCVIALEPK